MAREFTSGCDALFDLCDLRRIEWRRSITCAGNPQRRNARQQRIIGGRRRRLGKQGARALKIFPPRRAALRNRHRDGRARHTFDRQAILHGIRRRQIGRTVDQRPRQDEGPVGRRADRIRRRCVIGTGHHKPPTVWPRRPRAQYRNVVGKHVDELDGKVPFAGRWKHDRDGPLPQIEHAARIDRVVVGSGDFLSLDIGEIAVVDEDIGRALRQDPATDARHFDQRYRVEPGVARE